MTNRPDLFLMNVAFDVHGVQGYMLFCDPAGAGLRRVIVYGTGDAADFRIESAYGDTRDGWEPYLTEAGWLMAFIRPDTAEERS